MTNDERYHANTELFALKKVSFLSEVDIQYLSSSNLSDIWSCFALHLLINASTLVRVQR